ncbi:hypothetical protein LUW76_34630 [Actinomadura madurae]|uniref:hypothetical protein n=1 Tax=Actinomadura madurae TaxID=1993 RepID=UPI0020269C5E|nr:hypothetical protein [Actinomadura madurae]URM99057.1 hypothetical protein LUW76_34630 [Actinomadura madurae]
MRRPGPALGLFLLAPFVGEFLLGNLTGPDLALGLFLAPLYGCGALLVREIGRRSGGWPTMVLLAAAYALIEEGPVDQLLWNDDYAGHDYLSGASYIPALGMNVELTQAILALHTVWSICVPIAIVEAFAKKRGPWLGRTAMTITAVFYVLGALLVFLGNYSEEHFLASPAQLIGITTVIVGLIVLAFLMPLRRLARVRGRAPSPWMVGGAALALTSAYMGPSTLVTAGWYEWIGVVVWCVVVACGVPLVSRWSRRDGWDGPHRFALAAGATLTYVWTAFPTRPEGGGSLTVDLASNAVFGTVSIVILVLAGRRVAMRSDRSPAAVDPR